MSSILRALKKLENTPRHLEESQPLGSKFVPLADTGPQRTTAANLMMIIAGSIVCGLVIVTGWWLFSGKTTYPPASQQESRLSMPQTKTSPVTAKVSEAPQTTIVTVKPTQPSVDLNISRESAVPAQEATITKSQLPSVPIIEPKKILPIAAQPVEPVIQVTEKPDPEITGEVQADEIADVTIQKDLIQVKAREIPLLNDPEMKLQAITWSKNPQNRIAVINNRIMRQGDAVSGYRLVTINQDDVVLSDADKKWKLLFRIR